MTNNFWLDWSIQTISISNTILLVWLGLTVLLNAERRTWGAWIAGGGLLLGGLFFVGHTVVVSLDDGFKQGLGIWWQVGWIPVVALPLSWYMVVLWYAGFWESRSTALYKRQRPWYYSTLFTAIIMVGLILFTRPIPSYEEFTIIDLGLTPSLLDLPLTVVLYPVFIILCISLAMDALRKPGPTARIMGDIARERARPWLIATSIALMVVSILVAWALYWILIFAAGPQPLPNQYITLGAFDLGISLIITLAVILLGQAVVAYEIFTGKALPRRGLLRHWRRAILLAFGFGAVTAFSLNLAWEPIYTTILAAGLVTGFYALLSWRSYTERERYIDHLRPFLANQGLFEQLLTPSSNPQPELDIQSPFNALCGEVLETKSAYLIAHGPLAPLAGKPLTYPSHLQENFPNINELIPQFTQMKTQALQLSPGDFGNTSWAIPLWSERGLIGVMLLGNKQGGGLYTQEEIEIAQTSGARLIDTKASAEIAQRLMVLQRQRMAESQIIDQRARRVLHDDVLQQLHTAMLKLVKEKSRPNGGTSEAIELLADVHSQISNLLRDMPTTSLPEISKLGFIGALRKLVDEEMGVAFESIKWKIDYEAERQTQLISPLTAEVLFYATREAIRNAAKHGREGESIRPLHLIIHIKWEDGLQIQIEDDGVGVGSTERSVSIGSGQGLALHSTMMAVVGGELIVDSQPGEYTRVSLTLPQGN